jgi:hypothetical protein
MSTPAGDSGDVTFQVTHEEAGLILEALGAMRFSLVYRLIGKLQAQAQQQLGNGEKP